LQVRLSECLESQSLFDFAINGRFKGGYITRQYGRPETGVQAVQLELAQLNYMDEDSFEYDEKKAGAVQELIGRLLRISLE
jgi:N-formylglutamate deformylase